MKFTVLHENEIRYSLEDVLCSISGESEIKTALKKITWAINAFEEENEKSILNDKENHKYSSLVSMQKHLEHALSFFDNISDDSINVEISE